MLLRAFLAGELIGGGSETGAETLDAFATTPLGGAPPPLDAAELVLADFRLVGMLALLVGSAVPPTELVLDARASAFLDVAFAGGFSTAAGRTAALLDLDLRASDGEECAFTT
jgi:hypothetical protein